MANKQAIRLWVNALRSGKYPQTTSRLRDEDGFCCLGVACEVAIENGVVLDVTDDDHVIRYDGCMTVQPPSVTEWLGFDPDELEAGDGSPCIGTAGVTNYNLTAIEANDTRSWTFEQIASEIEATYLTD